MKIFIFELLATEDMKGFSRTAMLAVKKRRLKQQVMQEIRKNRNINVVFVENVFQRRETKKDMRKFTLEKNLLNVNSVIKDSFK